MAVTLFRDRVLREPRGMTHRMDFVSAANSTRGIAFVMPSCWTLNPPVNTVHGNNRRRQRLRMKPVHALVTCLLCLTVDV
jgi:hypothetical protein